MMRSCYEAAPSAWPREKRYARESRVADTSFPCRTSPSLATAEFLFFSLSFFFLLTISRPPGHVRTKKKSFTLYKLEPYDGGSGVQPRIGPGVQFAHAASGVRVRRSKCLLSRGLRPCTGYTCPAS